MFEDHGPLGNMLGFSTAEESNAFYRRNLAAGQKDFLLLSIYLHIVVTTQIMNA
jgi:methylmalonyl-CoA mutase N-terminal domain/subunit